MLIRWLLNIVYRVVEKCVLLSTICLLITATGCKSAKLIPVETTSSEVDSSVLRDSVIYTSVINKRDSVVYRDSLVITVLPTGEVVKKESYKNKEVYKDMKSQYDLLKSKYDALKAEKQKTVQVPYPVEKELTKWQKFKIDFGGYSLTIVVVIVFIYAGRELIRIYKK